MTAVRECENGPQEWSFPLMRWWMTRTGTLITALVVLTVAVGCGESPTPSPTPWPATASMLWAEGEGNATRYDDGMVNSENDQAVSEASRTCGFDFWV